MSLQKPPGGHLRPVSARVPPHDLDAEGAVLSAVLLDPSGLARVQDILEPGDFYSDANGLIYRAVQELSRVGTPIDVVTVASRLRAEELLPSVGGAAYLAQVSDATPSVPNLEAHAHIVAGLAKKRRVIALCQVIAAEGYCDTGPGGDWLDSVEARIGEVTHSKGDATTCSLGAALCAAYQDIERAAQHGGMFGLPSGLTQLDRVLGGFNPGDITVIGGRPGMGKTSLAMSIAQHIATHVEREKRSDGTTALQRFGVGVFSLEAPQRQLAKRWNFMEANVSSSKLKECGRLEPREWSAIAAAAARLSKLPIQIDATPALTPMALRSKTRRMRAELERKGLKLGLIVVDYLQLVDGSAGLPKNHNREQEVAVASRSIKSLALELGCHALVLSQITRALESRTNKDKRPRMSDLRESGAIEADASNVLLIYRDDYYDKESKDRGVAELIVEKQRDGRQAVVRVAFDAAVTRFHDLGDREDRFDDEAAV